MYMYNVLRILYTTIEIQSTLIFRVDILIHDSIDTTKFMLYMIQSLIALMQKIWNQENQVNY